MLMLMIEVNNKIDTIIGHPLGSSVGLALEKQYKKEGNNPYGIII